MKKIAIITFVRERSPGAVLQAYALQQFILKIQPKRVHVVDLDYSFKPLFDPKTKFVSLSKGIGAIRTLKGRICNPVHFRECKAFVENNIALSTKKYSCANIQSANELYDIFIVGSDQVWNGRMTDNSFDDFLLTFCNRDKYSYAASFAKVEIFEQYKSKILERLQSFKGISLREPIGVTDIASNTRETPYVHIDPTLLLDGADYLKFIDKSLVPERKFIFVYTVAHHNKLLDFVRRAQKETGYIVVYSTPYKESGLDDLPGIVRIKALHPKQFISLIANAELVYTTSFHGTAFSILLKKNFFVEINCADGVNTRVKSLLEILDLMERDIERIDDSYTALSDYSTVFEKLQNKREEAKQYLDGIIEN
ncbi:MAG: polysaccharide pyruvyl transferase family protein [Oscillospiraceae bacterium]|jgi:hypothetical protein|nr:polysaccharide pyruvyl transferase family protein [Oscillospiraceae bacterium]